MAACPTKTRLEARKTDTFPTLVGKFIDFCSAADDENVIKADAEKRHAAHKISEMIFFGFNFINYLRLSVLSASAPVRHQYYTKNANPSQHTSYGISGATFHKQIK